MLSYHRNVQTYYDIIRVFELQINHYTLTPVQHNIILHNSFFIRSKMYIEEMIGERIKMNIICFNLNQILKYCASNKVQVKTEDGRFQI